MAETFDKKFGVIFFFNPRNEKLTGNMPGEGLIRLASRGWGGSKAEGRDGCHLLHLSCAGEGDSSLLPAKQVGQDSHFLFAVGLVSHSHAHQCLASPACVHRPLPQEGSSSAPAPWGPNGPGADLQPVIPLSAPAQKNQPCPLFPGFGWDYGLFPPPLLARMSRSPPCLLPSVCGSFPSSYTFVTALVKCSNVLMAFV